MTQTIKDRRRQEMRGKGEEKKKEISDIDIFEKENIVK